MISDEMDYQYGKEISEKRRNIYDFREKRYHYFVGESNVSHHSISGQHFKRMAVGLLIDVETSQIVDANVTMVSAVAKNFICTQMIGRCIAEDNEEILTAFSRYHSGIQKSIVVAYKQAVDSYQKWCERCLYANEERE
ncbi:MAG: DUF3870 domain-containing protein [Candidatus Scatomorpha sp.]